MIPLHAQPCPDQPDQLRWITPADAVPFIGPVAAAPAPLAALLRDGTLSSITLEAAAVLTSLGPGRSWRVDGPRVRTAIHAALETRVGWSPAAGPDPHDDDAALYAAAKDLIGGPVGQFARSHGGRIELITVHDGEVTVRLAGACHGCPAARFTLHHRLESQLRRRYPGLRTVTDIDG